MKRTLIAFSGLVLLLATACQTTTERDGTIYEPAGAQRMTNAPPDTDARDINQRPYPGVNSDFDAEHGTGIYPRPRANP